MIKCLSSPQKPIQICIYALNILYNKKEINKQIELKNIVYFIKYFFLKLFFF